MKRLLPLLLLCSCAHSTVTRVEFEDTIDQSAPSAGCYEKRPDGSLVLMTWGTCKLYLDSLLDAKLRAE